MKKRVLTLVFILIPLLLSTGQYRLEIAYPNLNFLQPLDIQIPSDETNNVFVVTQEGIIYVFDNSSDVTGKQVFLDIKSKVRSGGELGLLGLVFHPDFKNNRYFYVNYTAPDPLRTVIARYTANKSIPPAADTGSESIILEFEQPYVNHNAGQLAFGPDGYLYIGTGDGGSGGDPQNNGQNRSSLLGKMLRIDVNKTQGNKNYSIPPDNPFVGNTEGFLEEIYAWGLRNPWRYSFDPVTNRLWTGDVGQNEWEEIDIIEKGRNYGWRIMEGTHCYNPQINCNTEGLALPVWEYAHNDEGGISVTGGYVYRGNQLTDLQGKYIYADFGSGRVWALTYNGPGSVQNELIVNSAKNISSFGVDKDKELYLCAFDGKIYKLVKSASSVMPGEKPQGYNLDYNYPNPFNPATTIIADIKDSGDIAIEVFTITGKKIATVFQGHVQPGRYKYSWDGSGFPVGVYLYKLTAGDFSMAKKMVLLK